MIIKCLELKSEKKTKIFDLFKKMLYLCIVVIPMTEEISISFFKYSMDILMTIRLRFEIEPTFNELLYLGVLHKHQAL